MSDTFVTTPSPGGGVTANLAVALGRSPGGANEPRLPTPIAKPSAFSPPTPTAPAATRGPAPVRFAVPDGQLVHGAPAQDHVGWLNRAVERGQITAQEAAQALREVGIEPLADARSPIQAEHDASFGMPAGPPDPSDYQHIRLADARDLNPEEFTAATGAIREAVAGFTIPVASAQNFVNAIEKADAEMSNCATQEERQALLNHWQQVLVNVYGEDALGDANFAPIAELANAMKDNPLIRHMRDFGLFFSPTVAQTLIIRGQQLAQWKSSRPK